MCYRDILQFLFIGNTVISSICQFFINANDMYTADNFRKNKLTPSKTQNIRMMNRYCSYEFGNPIRRMVVYAPEYGYNIIELYICHICQFGNPVCITDITDNNKKYQWPAVALLFGAWAKAHGYKTMSSKKAMPQFEVSVPSLGNDDILLKDQEYTPCIKVPPSDVRL